MSEHTVRTIRSLLEDRGYSSRVADDLEQRLAYLPNLVAIVSLIDGGFLVGFTGALGTRDVAHLLSKQGLKTTKITLAQRRKFRLTHKIPNSEQWAARYLIATWDA